MRRLRPVRANLEPRGTSLLTAVLPGLTSALRVGPLPDPSSVLCQSLLPEASSRWFFSLIMGVHRNRSVRTLWVAVMQQQSNHTGDQDQHWFRNFPELYENHEGNQANH